MSTLTIHEQNELAQYEQDIAIGFKAFYKAGQALQAIKEKKLYRQSHNTFDDYCFERWGIKKSRAYQLIDASKVYHNLLPESPHTASEGGVLSTMVDNVKEILPTSERQTRPLSKLEPAQQSEAWNKAVSNAGDKQPTGQQVSDAVRSFSKESQLDRSKSKVSKPVPNLSGFAQSSYDDFNQAGVDQAHASEDELRTMAEEQGGVYYSESELMGECCPNCGRAYQ